MKYKLLSALLVIFIFVHSCSEDDPNPGDDGMGSETGTVTDIHGNVYKTVKIGDQWWMAENLRTTRYQNGDEILNLTSRLDWKDINLSSGAYCSIDNADSTVATYGLLYNWYAVNDSRNIAPEGWHVPSEEEWRTMIDTLGGNYEAGVKMVDISSGLWDSPDSSATNESGFSVIPAGYRDFEGRFSAQAREAFFWTSTDDTHHYKYARFIQIGTWKSYYVNITMHSWTNGLSIRCVKD